MSAPNPHGARACIDASRRARRDGRLGEALASAQRAVQLAPLQPEPLAVLASACAALGDWHAVAATCRTLLAIAPGSAPAHLRLAVALRELRRPREAEDVLRAAVQRGLDLPGVRSELAAALLDQGLAAQAAYELERASADAPDDAVIHGRLGNVARALGDRAAAAGHYRRALTLDPEGTAWLGNLAFVVDATEAPAVLAALRQHRERAPSPVARITLLYAMARLHDLLDDPDAAFRTCLEGAAIKRRELANRGGGYVPARREAFVGALQSTFSAELLRARAGIGRPDARPIFIVGMPRSGTTLVEQILSCHSAVSAGGELPLVGRIVERLEQLGEYPAVVSRAEGSLLYRCASQYLAELERIAPDAPYVTDKMPANFEALGLIALLLPGARIVHCSREPLDTCVSIFFQNFTSTHHYAYDLESLGHYHGQYRRLMAHWERVLPTPPLELRYESLVGSPETECRRLLEFCGLPWESACLEFERNPRPVLTPSQEQVRRPLYRDSIGRWRRYAAHLDPLQRALGTG